MFLSEVQLLSYGAVLTAASIFPTTVSWRLQDELKKLNGGQEGGGPEDRLATLRKKLLAEKVFCNSRETRLGRF